MIKNIFLWILKIILVLLIFTIPYCSYVKSGIIGFNICNQILLIILSFSIWIFLFFLILKIKRDYWLLLLLPFAFWCHFGIIILYILAIMQSR